MSDVAALVQPAVTDHDHNDMQDLRAVINSTLRDNLGSREAMLDVIGAGEAIAFVGAGLSAPLGYPTWTDLLTKLHALASRVAPFTPSEASKTDVLQYAQAIKKHFETNGALDEFYSAVGREFVPRTELNCTDCHHRLVKLPFRAFVTTNYDDSLEQALNDLAIRDLPRANLDPGVVIKRNKADRHIVSMFLRSIAAPKGCQRRVGHLHGRYNDTANIILAASDYEDAYGLCLKGSPPREVPSLTLHRQLLWSLFATRQLVFFGCSMDDPYIKELLRLVTADLWEWDQPVHFVVLPIDQNSIQSIGNLTGAFARYGLKVVFFDNYDGTFSGLDQLLTDGIRRSGSSLPKAEANGTMQTLSTSFSPEQSQSSWLEDVNESTEKTLRKQ